MPYDRDSQYRIVEPQYTMSYTLSPHRYGMPTSRRSFFSRTELMHIAIAVVALTIAFAIVLYDPASHDVLYYLGLSALSVLLGFFIHEMSHKIVARRYGCWAEFRADFRGLALALVMSIIGILFAAPGAVYIIGNISREQNGKISLAGPGSNLAVALICMPFAFIEFSGLPDLVGEIASGLYFFNVFLAAFNMIPVRPLDGSKVWAWNKLIYTATLLAAGLLLVLALAGP